MCNRSAPLPPAEAAPPAAPPAGGALALSNAALRARVTQSSTDGAAVARVAADGLTSASCAPGAPPARCAAPVAARTLPERGAFWEAAFSDGVPSPPPPPPPRTKWTRRVPHPVLIGHAVCLVQVSRRTASRCGPTRGRGPRAGILRYVLRPTRPAGNPGKGDAACPISTG